MPMQTPQGFFKKESVVVTDKEGQVIGEIAELEPSRPMTVKEILQAIRDGNFRPLTPEEAEILKKGTSG